MTSGRKGAAGPHDDKLDAAIDWLLYLYGREAVSKSVARRSRRKPGEESKYLPTALEEMDRQIIELLSSKSKIRIPTRNSIKTMAISRSGLADDGALETGLKRCLKDCRELIFARLDILGSSGSYSHIRFRAVLEKYAAQKKLDEAYRKFARSRIAVIDDARANYRWRFGTLPADEWSLARIERAVREEQGPLTLLSEQLAAEKSKSGSH